MTVLSTWHEQGRKAHTVDPRMKQAVAEAKRSATFHCAPTALKGLIGLALAFSPIPAAVVMFGESVIGIHHAHQAHRLSRAADADEAARAMLREVEQRIDALQPEEARHLVRLLEREYGH